MVKFTKKAGLALEEAKGAKTLHITLVPGLAPKYEFGGDWVGRDVQLIGRTIGRAYKSKQLATRRAYPPSYESSEPVTTPTTEVSNV